MKIFKKITIYILLFYLFTITKVFAAFDIKARTAILQDYLSGEILFEKDITRSIYPASMTKIMTSIVVFDLLKAGDLSLDDKIMISENAWRLSQSGYSSMFIMVGDEVTVENLLKGIIVASGNDACVALAEGVAGTEEEFAMLMNTKAAEIGMENTNFTNSSGINDPDNYSTVEDILKMSNYLIKNYPNYYNYFKEKEFTWDRTGGEPITQGNRNPLLYKNFGADGIKTGYLAVEKYSLASSIKRGKRRLIAVGSGFETKNSRSRQSSKLLTWGLTNFDTIKIAEKNKNFVELDVWLGKKKTVKGYIKKDLYKTIPKARKKYLKAVVIYQGPILAPVQKDQKVAKLKLSYKDEILDELDIFAIEEVKKVNIFSGLIKSINYLIWGDV
jgi:D-alanyl-D-alanine carboxypeptidase (penicillin-binding protein 5/6)|tara:strand:- start:181 stop:1341 length:1161 start_codon:yes stop_codon:yes gene_type:complete